MRDFSPLYVRFGSGADIARSPDNVRFAPESGHHLGLFPPPALCEMPPLRPRD
jgi:hypothetical protein